MAHPDPNVSYDSVADWSDGTRILVNTVTADNGAVLQIIDLATGKTTSVNDGTVGKRDCCPL